MYSDAMDMLGDEQPGSIEATSAASGGARVFGAWTISHAHMLEKSMESAGSPGVQKVSLSLSDISALDTSGAWLLMKLKNQWERAGARVEFTNVSERHHILLSAISEAFKEVKAQTQPKRSLRNFGTAAQDWVISGIVDMGRILSLLGALMAAFGRRLVNPGSWRFAAIVTHMMRTGLTAVPIVALMSFVIGAIVAQQGAYQLGFYGADVMAIDMVAVLITRDMGVLLTAIMVAGRSGSAYTAEIGSMKMREEIDALKVIGLDPVDVLLFPRIAALVIVLPILTVIADYAALIGAQLALWLYIDMSWQIFLDRTRDAVPLTYFLMGVIKAPFMALIIGLIAMSEGLKVAGSSESLSKHTTVSVVKSIFMVIVVDGVFAVISAHLGY